MHIEGVIQDGQDSVDCKKMMSKCLDHIPPEALDHMFALRETAAAFGLAHGQITEEFLDAHNIYNTPGSTLRDNLVECRQHAFLVTHEMSVVRHREGEAIKAASILRLAESRDPVRKQNIADLQFLAKEEKKTASTASKLAEKDRVSKLTTAEKGAEKAQKRIAIDERKHTRDAAHEQKLFDALARNAAYRSENI